MKETKLPLLRLALNKKEKAPADLRTIYELLSATPLKDNFFKLILAMGQNEDFLFDICKAFKYKFYRKGQVVFEEGNPNTKHLYFIIKGQVGVFVKCIYQHAIERSKVNIESHIIQDKVIERAINLSKSDLIPKDDDSNKNKRRKGYMSQINNSFFPSPAYRASNFPDIDRKKSFNRRENGSEKRALVQSLLVDCAQSKSITRKNSILCRNNCFQGIEINSLFYPKNTEEQKALSEFQEYYLNDNSSISDEQIRNLCLSYGDKVRELGSWAIFGELAMEISRPRTATVVAFKNTEFIRIKQTDYQNIIKGALKAKKERMSQFLRHTLRFSKKEEDCNFKLVTSLLPLIQKMKVKKGDFVIQQGQICYNYYMIKRGEFRVNKIVAEEVSSDYYKDFSLDQTAEILTKLSGKSIRLGLCGAREVFGEEFLFSPQQIAEFNVECISPRGKLLILRSDVLKTFPSRFQETWKAIYENKRQFRIFQFQKTLMLLLHSQRRIKGCLLPNEFIGNFLLKPQEDSSVYGLTDNCFYSRKRNKASTKILNLSLKPEMLKKEPKGVIEDFESSKGLAKPSFLTNPSSSTKSFFKISSFGNRSQNAGDSKRDNDISTNFLRFQKIDAKLQRRLGNRITFY